MSQKIVPALAVLAFLASLASPAGAGQVYGNYGQAQRHDAGHHNSGSSCDSDVAVGTGVGAIVGGIIGHQFGKGSGNAAATIGGVILGGIAGNAIAKDACRDKNHDAYYYNNAYYDSFNDPDEGQQYGWNNPYTNNSGSVTAGETYDEGYNGNPGPCREFTQQVFIDGQPETATGIACRQPDGTWRIVNGS